LPVRSSGERKAWPLSRHEPLDATVETNEKGGKCSQTTQLIRKDVIF